MNKAFLKGMGVGIVAGSALVMIVTPPEKKKLMHSGAGRAIKAIGDIMEGIADSMN